MALKAWVMQKRMTPWYRKENKQESVHLCFNFSFGVELEEEQRLAVPFWTWQLWVASIVTRRRCLQADGYEPGEVGRQGGAEIKTLEELYQSRASQGVLLMIPSRERMGRGKPTSEKVLMGYLPLKEREKEAPGERIRSTDRKPQYKAK